MANEDKKNAVLRRIDEAPVRARQTWRHNAKGSTYHIIAVGIDGLTYEPVVIYVGHDGVVWTQPLDVFLKDIQTRFTRVADDGKPHVGSWHPQDGLEERPSGNNPELVESVAKSLEHIAAELREGSLELGNVEMTQTAMPAVSDADAIEYKRMLVITYKRKDT